MVMSCPFVDVRLRSSNVVLADRWHVAGSAIPGSTALFATGEPRPPVPD
jgi:hypothetical protein